MTILSLRSFNGEIPRLPADRLPEDSAQFAQNCEFGHGELRSLSGVVDAFETSVTPVRGIFTDNGLRFFVWDRPTRAYLHPTIDDTMRRVIYQSHGSGVRVAQTDTMKLSSNRPGSPTESWAAGVKAPTSISIDLTTDERWNGDDDARLSIDILVKTGGVAISSTLRATEVEVEEKWKSYLVTVPADLLTTEQAPVDGDGYITVNQNALAIRTVTLESGSGLPGGDGDDWVEHGGSVVLPSGQWKLRSDGRIQFTEPDDEEPYSALFGSIAVPPDAIDYMGKIWSPASTLFTALRDGTVSSQAGTADAKTVAFKVTIDNPVTGEVHLSQEAWSEQVSENVYRVRLAAEGGDETETIAYTAVAVNIWGEESAPCQEVVIDRLKGQRVTVTVSHTADADQVPLRGIAIYRTYASNQSASLFLLNTEPVSLSGGQAAIVDDTTEVQTTTVLATAEWDSPPLNAGNLTYVGNGFFALSSGKDLVFSEPNRPHAWPYRMTLPHGIVGIVAVEGGVLVTTQAQAYVVSGAHPTQMSQQLLPAEQAGWSDTTLARVDGAAIFAGNDGLVSVYGGQPSLDGSLQLFTREDWRRRFSGARQNLRLSQHDGRVLGLIDPTYPIASPADAQAFLLSLDEAAGAFCRLDIGTPVYCAVPTAATDGLYIGRDGGVARLGDGADLDLVWHSREALFPRPIAFGAAIVDCDGDFQVEVHADGAVISTRDVSGRSAFRLPAARPALRWSVRFSGSGVIRSFELGGSFAELQRV